MDRLNVYLDAHQGDKDPAIIAQLASLALLEQKHPVVAAALADELQAQKTHLKLIASENYCSVAVQQAMGSCFTDKYAEGVPGRRFYAACDRVDRVESHAIELLKKLYGADHANVQPHSGADANMLAYWALLVYRFEDEELLRLGEKKIENLSVDAYEAIRQRMVNQKVMGMSLNSGGHLTHGYLRNMSAKLMQSISYEVDPQTYRLDYRALRQQVIKERPFLLVAGYSAHSRALDFEMLRAIADEVGAFLLVDMAHFSGLVAGKIFKGIYNPVPYADIITSTTHKTLRGPRGGLVLCKERFKDIIDRACPLVFGGPLEHVIAAKAVAFEEASRPEFATYCRQVVVNAQRLASKLMAAGIPVLTGGTDNHMVIFDVHTPLGLTGREAERLLYSAGITVNRNSIPFDQNGSWHASGIRIGSPALTTLGMEEPQMELVADWIIEVLRAAVRHEDGTVGLPEEVRARVLHQVAQLLTHYSVYGGILDHI